MFNTHSADKEIDKYLKRKKSESVPKDIKNYKKKKKNTLYTPFFCIQIYSKLAKQSKYIAFMEASVVLLSPISFFTRDCTLKHCRLKFGLRTERICALVLVHCGKITDLE